MDFNYLTQKAETRPAGVKGWGNFALEVIPAGETVAAFGGQVIGRRQLDSLTPDRKSRCIQIDEELWLLSPETPEPGDMINHSCAPNCGLVGGTLVVAMRDIAVGEELVFDYAMCDTDDYDEFKCACGAKNCRGVITGKDWLLPELQDRYRGWFSSYLEKRIARSADLV
jgi:SET domain-containing protein